MAAPAISCLFIISTTALDPSKDWASGAKKGACMVRLGSSFPERLTVRSTHPLGMAWPVTEKDLSPH